MSGGPTKHSMDERKSHHLELTNRSQVGTHQLNELFDYEPVLNGFSKDKIVNEEIKVGKKTLKHPLWISSMTGGTSAAGPINKALAKVAGEFGLGMGLGSCRPLLEDDSSFSDFNLRPLIGENGVLFANFGMAQVSEELSKNGGHKLKEICERLQVDGLFLHINPLQEWYQPEGDRWYHSPLETIEELSQILKPLGLLLGVKEVGQGMGPSSLEALIKGPADIIEFGAFGGTNFSFLESLRNDSSSDTKSIKSGTSLYENKAQEFCFVGHSAEEMVIHVNRILAENTDLKGSKTFIVSGGIRSFLHGHYLLENLQDQGLYAMAKPFLEAALQGEEFLRGFVQSELEGRAIAKTFLRAKPLGGPGGV